MNEMWHAIAKERAYEILSSGEGGLSHNEAQRRLSQHGLNELKHEKKTSPLALFLQQFKDFLVIILLVSAFVSLGIGLLEGTGEEIVEAAAIFVVVAFIAVVGFIQEYKAEKELEALKRMVSPEATIVRGGTKLRIHAKNIVVGDILLLEAGDKIAADARIIDDVDLRVDESALTGESVPVEKDDGVLPEKTALPDRTNMAYTGTIVTYGKATTIVVATGMETELGKIAGHIQEIPHEETPLQAQLSRVGKQIGLIVITLAVIMFVAGALTRAEDTVTLFLAAVALAVAAVPEGLPAVVTVTLARGMRRMVSRHAIIRKLTAVETLGATTVICSDKTGTLTKNEMTVRRIYVSGEIIAVSGEGYEPEGEFTADKGREDMQLLLRIGALCNNSALTKMKDGWEIVGDPTEAALVVAAAKAGIGHKKLKEYERMEEHPFSSERKMMTTVHENPSGGKVAYVKGAVDVILKFCDRIVADGRERRISDEDRRRILSANDEFTADALRVLGLAYRSLPEDIPNEEVERNLVFAGLVGMIDPPREEAVKAIDVCESAGMRAVMITGDHKGTAIAVAKDMGLYTGRERVLEGVELECISDDELERIVGDVAIYARVSPEHKLRIVDALKKNGEVVAMTGDGVNDAPALKKADIGVAMGITGTEVSKEASDMVLTDDNFASIVSAVEEGRGIYDNIKLFIKYLLSCNIGEVMTIFIGILGWAKLPLLPLQILWMNLLTDAAPALALGFNPADPDIMQRPPRDPKEGIITKKTITKFVGVGGLMCAGTLYVFLHMLSATPEKAQTMAFTTLVLFQMFYVLSCRSEKHTLFEVGVFSNKYLILAVAFSVMLHIAVVNVGFLQAIFNTVTLNASDWAFAVIVSSTVFIIPQALRVWR
jgi:Ca2+-transporting ATPase